MHLSNTKQYKIIFDTTNNMILLNFSVNRFVVSNEAFDAGYFCP